jgi:hypothetical protein
MPNVFVAGSITIKNLDEAFRNRLSIVSERGFRVLVGDAGGADTSIQEELKDSGNQNVTVYCSGPEPRNNLGHWPVEHVFTSAEPGSRAFFTAKDKKMAENADYGLMVWDKKSPGTLNNVIELMQLGRASVVYLHKDRRFVDVKGINDLEYLVSKMSSGAKEQAEKKISLSARLRKLQNEQFRLPV